MISANSLDYNYEHGLLENKGVNVFPSHKNFHPIYNQIRELTRDIQANVNILGVDEFCDLISHYPEDSFCKKFFYYTEGVIDFPEDNLYVLEDPNFCGFISHITDSCSQLWWKYLKPVYNVNLSSREYSYNKVKEKIENSLHNDQIVFLSSSTYQDDRDTNFFNRGGLNIDSMFSFCLETGMNAVLRHRGSQKFKCASIYPDKVSYFPKLSNDDFDEFLSDGDFYFLPSKQIHASSLSHAMSHGLIPIVSKGWGFGDYCFDFNSIVFDENFFEKISFLYHNRDILVKMKLNVLNYYMTNLHSTIHSLSIKHIIESVK